MSDLVEAVARAICDVAHPVVPGEMDWRTWLPEARAVLALPSIATALRLAEAHMAYVDYVFSNEPHDGIKQNNLYADDAEALAAYREARR